MSDERAVRDAFAQQAIWCERLGSPFTARLMRVLERTLDRSTLTGRTVLDWSGVADGRGDALPLRLAGALHALARRGTPPGLAAAWPPVPTVDDAELARAVASALAEADGTLHGWLAHPPQTNEIGRSAVLMGGLVTLAAEVELPFALYEIGASAGLNLLPDRYAHRLGERDAGDPGSAVRLAPEWRGDTPSGPEPVIVRRRGCDRAPVDVADPAARERLLAYVWPDQRERLERLTAALGIARADPPRVERADAADWVEATLGVEAEAGTARVLMHSIAMQYFPPETTRRIDAHMARCGAAASARAPLAWLSLEQYRERGPALRLTLWPGGETRLLARAQAHGASVDWLD